MVGIAENNAFLFILIDGHSGKNNRELKHVWFVSGFHCSCTVGRTAASVVWQLECSLEMNHVRSILQIGNKWVFF